jgi:SCY1-like protein 1
MFSSLTSGVSSLLSSSPYTIGEPVASWSTSLKWQLFHGTKKSGGAAVSVFKLSKKGAEPDTIETAQNACQRLKTLRCPNIVTFLDKIETNEELLLITEALAPMEQSLQAMRDQKDGVGADALIIKGLHSILSALDFINRHAKLIHGFVCPASVFVTPSGDWKLGCMDLVAAIEGPAGPSENFTKHEKLLEETYRSPERKQGNFGSVFSSPSSLDVYSLGQLIRILFKGRETTLDPKMQQLVVLMANANATMRPTPEQLLATNSFDHPLLKDIQFMEELHLKPPEELKSFFQAFAGRIDAIPKGVLEHKLLPCLTQVYIVSPLYVGSAVGRTNDR